MNIKFLTIGKISTRTPGKFRPIIRFTGLWLNEIGFIPEKHVGIRFNNKCLIFNIYDKNNPSYEKFINPAGLLKISLRIENGKYAPCFEIKGRWLNDLGFSIGNTVSVEYEIGLIKVKMFNLNEFINQIH